MADLEIPPALVLGGGGGWSDEVDAAVASVPPHLRLIRPGYLRFSDLPGFLGGATVVAFPSRGEGFGLPGSPGDGVRGPGADDRLHVAARGRRRGRRLYRTRLRQHPRLAPRPARRRRAAESLAEAGYDRSQEFTWEASAEAHLACYRRAAEQTAADVSAV